MSEWIKINKDDPATWPPLDMRHAEDPVWCHMVVDGKSVLGYRNPLYYDAERLRIFRPLSKYVGCAFHCFWEDADGYENEAGDTPTHWMPFPEPPTEEGVTK